MSNLFVLKKKVKRVNLTLYFGVIDIIRDTFSKAKMASPFHSLSTRPPHPNTLSAPLLMHFIYLFQVK